MGEAGGRSAATDMIFIIYSKSGRWWNGSRWLDTATALQQPRNAQLTGERSFKDLRAANAAMGADTDLDIRTR
jgi:hypothetical protein